MPKGVKKRKPKFRSNLTNRASYNKRALKRKLQSHSSETAIKEAWDVKKTAKENLSSMALAADPNDVVPIKKKRRPIIDAVPLEDVHLPAMEIDVQTSHPKRFKKKVNPKAAAVVSIIEDKATKELQKVAEEKDTIRRHHLPDRDIELVIYFMEKYGNDFMAMARDPRNLFQHTPKQIRKLFNIFKSSPLYKVING